MISLKNFSVLMIAILTVFIHLAVEVAKEEHKMRRDVLSRVMLVFSNISDEQEDDDNDDLRCDCITTRHDSCSCHCSRY